MEQGLSVILVNFRAASELIDCLTSLKGESPGLAFEIIVVDNGSDPGEPERVLSAHPDVQWMPMERNVGFARAANVGLRVARNERILLLNPDTVVLDGAVQKCLNYLDGQSDLEIGLLGCLHRNPDGSLQPSIYRQQDWPSPWNAIREIPRYLLRAKAQAQIAALHDATCPCDALQGSFLLMKKPVLDRAGLLDPDFFLYYEEIEWARRIRKAGFTNVFVAEAEIIHYRHSQSAGSAETIRQMAQSKELFVLKVWGRSGLVIYTLANYANCLMLLPFLPFSSAARRWCRDYRPLSLSHWRPMRQMPA